MATPPAKTAISGSPSRAAANAGFGALYDYLVGLLGVTGDAADARTALGTDVYKKLPVAASLTPGEVYVISAGITLNVGADPGTVYGLYNNSAAAVTITQGAGLTLRRAGTTLTGNFTIAPRGMASVWCLSGTEYVGSGAGVA